MELDQAERQFASVLMSELDNGSLEQLPGPPHLPGGVSEVSALVVDPLLDELLVVMARLDSRGVRVTAAESFAQAKPILSSQPPSILITAIRLGAYNGLHLVLRAKETRPDIAALVTSPVDDVVLRSDAEKMGATFVVTPIDEKNLIAAVLQTYFRRDASAPPVRPPFERRQRERRTDATAFHQDRRSVDRRRELPWTVEGTRSPV